ncbi:MAG: peptidoglycan-binding protein LysM [Acidobacteria bacterium]|nr:MAG: peptidoglycan-binding protein LysM [Acidobacteriota bacterium]
MGLISFVRDAGKKLFGGDDEAEIAAADEAKAEEARRRLAERRSAALKREIEDLGLKVDDLAVEIDGGTARICGTCESQAEREKVVLAVGNVRGITEVNDDDLAVTAVEAEAVFYTVQPGDSLSKIAKVHYGNAMKYPVIFEANKPMLTHPDKIYPGQVLRIPPADA